MKYVFFGSPRFAEIILSHLIDVGLPPVAIVCNPDRPFGRKKIITPPLTKMLVTTRAKDISILQPEKPANVADVLQTLGADLFVVAAYAQIIPETILEIPRLGTLGVHPSLLPKYRGASPIQSTILNGGTETGTTIYVMDSGMDHGPIVESEKCSIEPDASYLILEEKLAHLSAKLLVQAIPAFTEGKANVRPQEETQASYTKKFETEDAFIDEQDLLAAENGDAKKAISILRKINAFNPEPGAWTMRNARRVKMLAAKIENDRLTLTEIQNEGERPKAI